MWIETKTELKKLFNLDTGHFITKDEKGRNPYVRYNSGITFENIFEGSEAECQAEYERLKEILLSNEEAKSNEKVTKDEIANRLIELKIYWNILT